MMKTAIAFAATLALAAPGAGAQEKKADKPAAQTEAAKAPAKQVTATAAGKAATASAAGGSETRDWAKIDSNRDNLISPDEMEKYLQESWAARKK